VFGSQCVVLAIDARRRPDNVGWEVFSHGGRRATGRDAVEWATVGEQLGAGEILLTSMDNDGVQNGYDVALLQAVSSAVRLPVIASGGAGTAAHMHEALTTGGAEAALAASIFHFGEVSIASVKEELAKRGLEMRR
jgi:cyclase